MIYDRSRAYLLLHYPVSLILIENKKTMASSNEDGIVATAEQVGSMSLGKSVERKDNESKDAEEANGTTPTKLCSACEKKSDALMKCRACKCVWYCDKKCQNKHWKEHKTECKRIKKELEKRGGKLDIGMELDIGPLPDLPPRDECPICMRALPLHDKLQAYAACCGKTICCGCDHQHEIKTEGQVTSCAFCREPMPRSDEEILAQLRKRVERKDPRALCNMGMEYSDGGLGLPVDQAKSIELLRQSADLGFPPAQYQLAACYYNGEMGLKEDQEEANKCWEKAAKGGHLPSLHNLGSIEYENGDYVTAMRHWRLGASGGYRGSAEHLIECFEKWLLHHADLAETLQAMYRSKAEMKSEDRAKYIKHLKATGEYKEEYDL